MACEARKENDEMVCRCGKRWDVKDPDPPKCQTERLQRVGRTITVGYAGGRATCFGAGGAGGSGVALPPTPGAPTQVTCRPPRPIAALIPATLSPDVAYAMAKAYEAIRDNGRIGAMSAAYKIYLDSLNK